MNARKFFILVVACMILFTGFACAKPDKVYDIKNKDKDINKISINDTNIDSYIVDKISDHEISISKKEKDNKHTTSIVTVSEIDANAIDIDDDGLFGIVRLDDNGTVISSMIVTKAQLTSGIPLTFSTNIINGYYAIYTKTETVTDINSAYLLGESFASNKTSVISVNITPTYVGSDPYSEIAALNPTAWYKLDNTSGTTIIDSSGHGYNGSSAGGTTWDNGKYNNGIRCDGINDRAYINHKPAFNTSSFSIFGWYYIYPNIATKAYPGFFSKRDSGWGMLYTHNVSKYISYRIYNSSGNQFDYVTASNIVDIEKWQFIGISVNNTSKQVKIYKDNKLLYTGTYKGVVRYGADPYLICSQGSNYLNATADNVIIFDRVLNSTEISTLYYDKPEQLQAKTNANSTYSTMWNSSSNNPLTLPVSSMDGLINALQFNVPNVVVQNDVTISDYNQTVSPFIATSSVYFTEDATLVNQYEDNGISYTNITKTFTHASDSGTIFAELRRVGYFGTPELFTNDSAATISVNATHIIITTGAHAAGSSNYYNIKVPKYRTIGSYNKIGTIQNVTQSLTLGRSIPSNQTVSVTADITPTYVGSDPYSEIESLYPHIWAWWKCDESNGSIIYDSSGNNRHMYRYNGMNWTSGKYNNAAYFDGTNDYANTALLIPPVNYTIAMDVNIQSLYEYETIYNVISDRDLLVFDISTIEGTKRLRAFGYMPTLQGFYAGASKPPVVTTGKHRIVVSCNSTNMLYMYDNVLVGNKLISRTYSSIPAYCVLATRAPAKTNCINSNIDNVIILDVFANDSILNVLKYDTLEQLQVKTNVNSTYSTMWNNTEDNGLAIPYSSTEGLIDSLSFKLPNTITQNGVVIRDYNQTASPFNITATVRNDGTGDITSVSEDMLTGNRMRINIIHSPGQDYDTESLIYPLLFGYTANPQLSSNDTSASIRTNSTHVIITTGPIDYGNSYYYTIVLSKGNSSLVTPTIIGLTLVPTTIIVASYVLRKRKSRGE